MAIKSGNSIIWLGDSTTSYIRSKDNIISFGSPMFKITGSGGGYISIEGTEVTISNDLVLKGKIKTDGQEGQTCSVVFVDGSSLTFKNGILVSGVAGDLVTIS